MKYTVYFETYGKRMKTTVEATTASQAAQIVRDRLRIIRVEDDTVEHLKNMLGMK